VAKKASSKKPAPAKKPAKPATAKSASAKSANTRKPAAKPSRAAANQPAARTAKSASQKSAASTKASSAKAPAPKVGSSKAAPVAKAPPPKAAASKGKGNAPAANSPPANAFNNRPVPTMVTTDGKPKKNQAGFNTKELEHFRDLLLTKRRELVGDMSQMEREALRSAGGTNLSNLPLHMADMGTDNYEQEFTLGLVEKDRNLLREINQALAKIQDGSYGICEGTGKPIGKVRLEIQPWSRFSVEYARQKEQGFRRMM
jgi:DnaK suppressor protein